VFYYALLYYISLTIIIGVWFSVMDIKIRKIKNKFIFLYFVLIVPLFPFIDFNNLFSLFIPLLLFYMILFGFYILGLFGGADFKYLSISILGMFIFDVISWKMLFNFLFIIACSLIVLRIAFYFLYNRKMRSVFPQLFNYLDIPVGSLQFLKVMVYYPLSLLENQVFAPINIDKSNNKGIANLSEPYNINLDVIENFADIDLSDHEYDRKIRSGKIRYIGKVALPRNLIKINETPVLFYQPVIPLIPLLFSIHIIIFLYALL